MKSFQAKLTLYVIIGALFIAGIIGDGIQTFVSFAIVSALILILYFNNYSIKSKLKYFSAIHKNENYLSGAEDEPRMVRNLTPEEEIILSDMVSKTKRLHDNLWLITVLSAAMDGVFIFFLFKYPLFVENGIQLFIALVAIQATLITSALRHERLYLDLRTPAFRIAGHIVKEEQKQKYDVKRILHIRNMTFTENEFNDLKKIFNQTHDGEKIEIEYSPRTKIVWKWKKI